MIFNMTRPGLIPINTVPFLINNHKTYNGQEQSPSMRYFNSAAMTLAGTLSATNAGTYVVKFTPKPGYCWSDGTATAEECTWYIVKAAATLSIDKTSITLNANQTAAYINVTYEGGSLRVGTSDPTVAKPTISGTNEVRVSSVNKKSGTATISISLTPDSNHKSVASKSCTVTADF